MPNQVLYHHCGSSYINEKWWYRIDWRFEHVGSNWPSSLNGEEITPARLGYDVGDVITFRILILWEDEIFEKDNWHVQDFRVKVGPSENPLPTLPNWYSGDVHTHGAHTDHCWEWGAPTEYQAIANKAIGLNWVTVTDHSFCLGYRDECGFSGTFWEHLQYEANLYSEPDFVVIVGEELNTDKGDLDEDIDHLEWHREFLVYNIEEYIEGAFSTSLLAWFPGVVPPIPIDGKLVGTILSPDSALKRVAAQNGFAYLAHSGAYEGYGDGTEPIKELALNHDCFRGFQIFNERKTHSSDNPVHPWGDNPHLGIWQEEHSDWDSELLAELPRWDNWLSQKLGPPLRKIFISGGSDAHGGFNYASFKTSDLWGWLNLGSGSNSTAAGCVRTVVYCPDGFSCANILDALKNGRSVVTDGPMLIFGIDINGDGDIEDPEDLIIGDGDDDEDGNYDEKCQLTRNPLAKFLFKWNSNELFGPVYLIELYQGSSTTRENPMKIVTFYPNSYSGEANIGFLDSASFEVEEPYYFRAVAYSRTGNGVGEMYRCFTNPIWIKCSSNPFIIVMSPNGGEVLEPNTQYNITWITRDNAIVQYVDLYYSTDGGITYSYIDRIYNPNPVVDETWEGSYLWTIPMENATACKVKIIAYDNEGKSNTDESDGTFSIIRIFAPTNFTANSVSSNKIILTWQDNSSYEDGYVIEEQHAGSDWEVLDTLEPNTESYTHYVSRYTDHWYRLHAYNLTYNICSDTVYTWATTSPILAESGVLAGHDNIIRLNDVLYALWSRPKERKVFTSYSTNNGLNWSSPSEHWLPPVNGPDPGQIIVWSTNSDTIGIATTPEYDSAQQPYSWDVFVGYTPHNSNNVVGNYHKISTIDYNYNTPAAAIYDDKLDKHFVIFGVFRHDSVKGETQQWELYSMEVSHDFTDITSQVIAQGGGWPVFDPLRITCGKVKDTITIIVEGYKVCRDQTLEDSVVAWKYDGDSWVKRTAPLPKGKHYYLTKGGKLVYISDDIEIRFTQLTPSGYTRPEIVHVANDTLNCYPVLAEKDGIKLVVWQENDELYYSYKIYSSWSSPKQLTLSYTSSESPSIVIRKYVSDYASAGSISPTGIGIMAPPPPSISTYYYLECLYRDGCGILYKEKHFLTLPSFGGGFTGTELLRTMLYDITPSILTDGMLPIRYSLSNNSEVKFTIYDVMGRIIKTLELSNKPGHHTLNLNIGSLSSGIYFITMETPNYRATKKFSILRYK